MKKVFFIHVFPLIAFGMLESMVKISRGVGGKYGMVIKVLLTSNIPTLLNLLQNIAVILKEGKLWRGASNWYPQYIVFIEK